MLASIVAGWSFGSNQRDNLPDPVADWFAGTEPPDEAAEFCFGSRAFKRLPLRGDGATQAARLASPAYGRERSRKSRIAKLQRSLDRRS